MLSEKHGGAEDGRNSRAKLVPGLTAIRREIAFLREMQSTLEGEEARKLNVITNALEVALGELLKGRAHANRT